MNSYPRISVLMPAYNTAAYVGKAVESILNQSYADFEFIVVDDCSTDDTPLIVADYARQDNRIRLIQNTRNLGRSGARNTALVAGPCGDYIAIMDSDDIAYPERFEQQILFLDANPDIVALGTQVRNIDEHEFPTPEQTNLPQTHGSLIWSLLYSVPFCQPSVMMRAEVAHQLGQYQEGSAVEDAEFWTRLVYRGRFANLPQILLDYRMPSARLIQRLEDWDAALREVSQLFIEQLLNEPVDLTTVYHIHYSIFHRNDLHLELHELLQCISILQRLFKGMIDKGLLQPEDTEEIAKVMLHQYQVLLSYRLN